MKGATLFNAHQYRKSFRTKEDSAIFDPSSTYSFSIPYFTRLNRAINVIPCTSSLWRRKASRYLETIFRREHDRYIGTDYRRNDRSDRCSSLVPRVSLIGGHERFSEPSCPSNCSNDVPASRDRQNFLITR